MLHVELRYYANNRNELLKRYLDKYLVIKGRKVIATYDTHAMAREESLKTMSIGTFLIEHCIPRHSML